MFRDVARSKQKMTHDECVEVLEQSLRGVLSVLGDDGYPYGVTLNHYYCPEDGKLYFHSGLHGHKIDALRRCDKASFTVTDGGQAEEGDWALRFRSVVVFGRVTFIEDREKIYDISRRLSRKFPCGEDYIAREIESAGPRTALFALTPEHITGKRVKES